ncbi:MAG TPA: Clp protease N-terminal domain-containing protein [Mycobacteriales bacterium]|nr:Clp protease N-terminal domain-containing protein [Mycobacteriales bacterium]
MTKPRLSDLIDGINAQYPDRPLEQLTAAVMLADFMNEVADHLIGHFVDQARHSGASWTEIGGCIGVTKQAAQQRFSPKADPNMFTWFTEKARQVVIQSQEAARATGQSEIAVEHLLLGLLTTPDGLAMRALADQKLTPGAIRKAADAAIPPAPDGAVSPTMIPYTAPARKVLELTMREALRLGHNYIGTEHILLALLAREAETPGPLHSLGVDPAAAEAHMLAAIGAIASATPAAG